MDASVAMSLGCSPSASTTGPIDPSGNRSPCARKLETSSGFWSSACPGCRCRLRNRSYATYGIAAAADLDRSAVDGREEFADEVGVPEVVEHGSIEILRDPHHREIGGAAQGLGELPPTEPDDVEQRLLDRVLRDVANAEGGCERFRDRRLPRPRKPGHHDEGPRSALWPFGWCAAAHVGSFADPRSRRWRSAASRPTWVKTSWISPESTSRSASSNGTRQISMPSSVPSRCGSPRESPVARKMMPRPSVIEFDNVNRASSRHVVALAPVSSASSRWAPSSGSSSNGTPPPGTLHVNRSSVERCWP